MFTCSKGVKIRLRSEVVKQFRAEVLPRLAGVLKVAMVGGSSTDPELPQLPDGVTVSYFGVEESLDQTDFYYLDLNEIDHTLKPQYDLVISSQVLEHVWDLRSATINLARLVRPGGLLWLACPASNFPHGSPHYYSAGYSPELLTRLLASADLEIVSSGCLGSKRNYVWTHAFRHWPSDYESSHPVSARFIANLRSDGRAWKRVWQAVKGLRTILLLPLDATVQHNIDYATESWALARKPEIHASIDA